MTDLLHTDRHSDAETIYSSLLDAEEMIDAHFAAKRLYDPSIHADFDNTQEFENALLSDLARTHSRFT